MTINSITFEDKSSPDNPDGVPRRHPDTPASQANPRTPTLSTSLEPRSGVLTKPFVFGQPLPNTETPSNAFTCWNTPFTQNTNTGVILSNSGVVLFHTNIVSTHGFHDSVIYSRPTDIVKDFLENHQYTEPAYNRYLYFGSIYSNESPQSITFEDESSSVISQTPTLLRSSGVLTIPEFEPDDDFVLRQQRPRYNNDTNDIHENNIVEETHSTNALVQLLDASSVRFLMATPRALDRNNLTVYYYDTLIGNADEDDTNEDCESTDTEEQYIAGMNLEHDFIIEGDNSSDVLSIASSIDPDADYYENEGFDSV